jgi:Fur family ferric uptake transcriptional regulator
MNIIRKKSNAISGRPVTSQRTLLLNILRKSDKHLDADELHLKLFKDLGLITESGLGDTHSHYEITDKAHHHHLICLNCGKITEFSNPLIKKAIAEIQKESGYDIISVQLKIEGYCSECKQKK